MTEIGTLQRQTRLLLQDVLNEKTIVIEEQMRQILEYRQEIDRLGRVEKQKHGQVEELQLDSLLQNKFITNEGNNYHLLVDVTQLMRQGAASFLIDAHVDIVKEIDDDRHKAYQLLSEAYARLNEENKGLVIKAAERDKQHEEVVNQLKEQMAQSKEQFALAIGQLEGKIQILQDENEMMEIEAKQQKGERSNFTKEKDYRQEYESMSKKYEEKMQLLQRLTVEHEQLKLRLEQNEQKTKNLWQQNRQLIVEKKDLLLRCDQLKEQNRLIRESIDESGLTSKVEILRLTPVQAEQQQYFESKAKVYQQKCAELLKENQDYSQNLLKIQKQKNSLLQKNAKLASLLEKKQQKTIVKLESEKEISEIDEELLPFWSQLQTLLKQLSAQNQIIIRNKQSGSQKEVLRTSRNLEVNLLSKLSGKKPRQMEEYLLASPAEKDTSFPVAQTPHQKEPIAEKQATKSKHRKKMIRIGY